MAAKEYSPKFGGSSARALVGQIGPRALWLVWLLVAVVAANTMVDHIKPDQVGVIMNNLTKSARVQTRAGMVIHAPFGITKVYILDKTNISVWMAGDQGKGDRATADNVRVKTSDGTNVYVDVELTYNIMPESAKTVIRTFGRGETYKLGFVRSFARSEVRDALGQLSLLDTTKSELRREKAEDARLKINDQLSSFGITVSSLSITNLDYNPQYKEMIAQRLSTEQEVENQESARITAESAKLALEQAASRRKNTEMEKVRGEQQKRVIDAQGEAAKTVKEAEAQAYELRKGGDREFEVAQNEARAIEREGLTKADGIKQMADAYSKGGLALVREELAKKYMGKKINGKPYTIESRIDRLRVEHEEAAAAGVGRGKGAGQ